VSVILLRVGIDLGAGGILGPIFADGSFEYIPIPDPFGRDERTYGNTKGPCTGLPLIEYFPANKRLLMRNRAMHVDPEFETFTYGDPGLSKRGLIRLGSDDLLVFYAGLEPWDYRASAGLYIIGYFVVSRAGFIGDFSLEELNDLFGANAHVRIPQTLTEQRDKLVLVKGGLGSRLLMRAQPISSVGLNSAGQNLSVLSSDMQRIFGDFNGKIAIQRSPARLVLARFTATAEAFVRALP
jgi:hypothetical protein